MKKKHILLVSALLVLISGAFFIYHFHSSPLIPQTSGLPPVSQRIASSSPPARKTIVPVKLSAIQPVIYPGVADVTSESPKVFAYAHGTVEADGKLFIGMSDASGNPFPSNEIVVFDDAKDISHPTFVSLPAEGDINTMVYDSVNDKVYFDLSDSHALELYTLDPHTDALSLLIGTTSVDVGRRPAIVTDGTYIYGITNTDPSSVFRYKIQGGELAVSPSGHIPMGHSAAIGIYGSTTELYFGGGMSDGFEKDDAATLQPLAKAQIDPCSMTDDMPFRQTSSGGGYVYVGCEMVPYGIRVDTRDLSYERFSLPGASLGLFVYGGDLYNAAEDGFVDVFPREDLSHMHRYLVTDAAAPLDTKGQSLEVNEILYSPEADRLFITGWYGIKGLYEVATGTSAVESAAAIQAMPAAQPAFHMAD